MHEKRPEHRGLGRRPGTAVIDRIDQHRHAEHIGEQDELLALVVALLPGGGEELDRFEPFLLGQFDFAHEVVQMPDQALHDPAKARVGVIGKARDHRVGQLGFNFVLQLLLH